MLQKKPQARPTVRQLLSLPYVRGYIDKYKLLVQQILDAPPLEPSYASRPRIG